jgi:hypothetical protein
MCTDESDRLIIKYWGITPLGKNQVLQKFTMSYEGNKDSSHKQAKEKTSHN